MPPKKRYFVGGRPFEYGGYKRPLTKWQRAKQAFRTVAKIGAALGTSERLYRRARRYYGYYKKYGPGGPTYQKALPAPSRSRTRNKTPSLWYKRGKRYKSRHPKLY